jgi:hypothetical protein
MAVPGGCEHLKSDLFELVCVHVEVPEPDYRRWYTGGGLRYALVCGSCANDSLARAEALRALCPACFERIAADGAWDGVVGMPAILERTTNLRFTHRDVALPRGCTGPLRAIVPASTAARYGWHLRRMERLSGSIWSRAGRRQRRPSPLGRSSLKRP